MTAAKPMSRSVHLANRWVLATHNEGKVAEFNTLFAPLGISLVSAASLQLAEPEETGSTFAQNAALKSHAAVNATHMPSLADDSGIVIPALKGAPGIYSARWAGPNKDFSAAMQRVQNELGEAAQGANASFICVLSLAWENASGGVESVEFEGEISGTLTFPPRGARGFGYDPIFVPHGSDRTFAEYDAAEKHRISHRARALEKLLDSLQHHFILTHS